MAVLFAGGSACFVVASLPGFVQLVGSAVVGVVYFVGSLQFTSAAAIQWLLTIRRLGLDWWASAIQFVGTLLFNLNTYDAMQEGLDANSYDRLVWTPDVLGSICFLVASYLAYAQCYRRFLPPSAARPRVGDRDGEPRRLGRLRDRSDRRVLGSDVRIRPRPGGRKRLHRARRPVLPRRGAPAPPRNERFTPVG